MRRVGIATVTFLLVVLGAAPAAAHMDSGHPGVDIGITQVVRHADGHVTAWGWAVCPPGEDWSGGIQVNEGAERVDGVARHEGAPITVTCDGKVHAWGPSKTDRLWYGGVKTDGVKTWQAKMQSPSPPADWVHKDMGHRGTVTVTFAP